MCGIVCLCNFSKDISDQENKLKAMTHLLRYRGPNDTGEYISSHILMGHKRLSIIDLKNGKQPMQYKVKNKLYTITYNGEIYNMIDIKKELVELGYTFKTTSDTEVILAAYDAYKEQCAEKFEGIFAFVISDGNTLFIARDQMGVKPLYYCLKKDTLIIASEIKCILYYLNEAVIDDEGIKELLGLGPSCSPGKTIYKNIYSLRPAHYMIYDGQISICRYWMPKNKQHTDTLEQTIKKVKSLVIDSIQKQLLSDVPISSMLSGGLDSSIITAISSQFINNLSTYSISYEGQKEHFKAYDYQTTMDDDYINEMKDRYATQHHNIILTQEELIHSLETALIARDMPGMADIDSSFYLFSNEIAKQHKVCLSGECADEIFGGYPWFYKEELYNQPHFPWMRELDTKISLFHKDIQKLNIKDYIIQQYQNTLKEIDTSDQKKQMMYLNMEWFMQTLLTRCDSQTMRSSIEVRVPFANTTIFEYMYNMPKSYMFYNNEEKGILRKAFEDFLPEDIVHRKKNPYPKTHHPLYTKLISEKLNEILEDENNILYQLFDKKALFQLIESKGKSFQVPWFGQLMTGPQLLAYLYQIALWGKIYKIRIDRT
ncbi:MAG: asparagine synthase (glutamine-hydrolyzing) [Bacilli bacterium]|nr:asparagine synthase (glutamine-hydrolyzing) [Bacilli bacterium]